MWDNHTLRAGRKCTLRVEITLLRVEITLLRFVIADLFCFLEGGAYYLPSH
jgi:hypothetical protein